MNNYHRTVLAACCIGMAVLGVCGDNLANDTGLSPSRHAGRPPGHLEATYVACDEYAGLGLVPLAHVRDRVPDAYTILEARPGFATIVTQAASCREMRVNGAWRRPGIFAQVGVAVRAPLASGNGDFYQLLFTTDHPQLASLLRQRGVNAYYAPQLSYAIHDGPTLAVDVPTPRKLAFVLSGPITRPDPLGPPHPPAVFNYYVQTTHAGHVLQQNVVKGIRFGEGSGVTLSAIGREMQAIVGGDLFMFPIFSTPEIFDHATLTVVVEAF